MGQVVCKGGSLDMGRRPGHGVGVCRRDHETVWGGDMGQEWWGGDMRREWWEGDMGRGHGTGVVGRGHRMGVVGRGYGTASVDSFYSCEIKCFGN